MLLPFLKDREAAGQTIRVGVIGCGQMGEGLTAQMELMHAMEASVVADIVPGLAAKALVGAGVLHNSNCINPVCSTAIAAILKSYSVVIED